jgi:hypothetical protein
MSQILARLGGDEFTVLMPDIAGAQDAAVVARRIESRLEPPFELPGQSVFVIASIGIATGVAQQDRSEALLRDADAAMYEAKARGRAGHAVFDRARHSRDRKRGNRDGVTALHAGRARLQPRSRLPPRPAGAPDELAALLRTVNPTEVTVAARLARLQ